MRKAKSVASLATSASKKREKKKDVTMKEREANWRIEPTRGIPEYNAETDPYCPRAQVRKYNHDKRTDAEESAAKAKSAEEWVRRTLRSKFDDVPLRTAPSLRAKAASSVNGPESSGEVEILQKVIVRENLLGELHKLLQSQTDVSSCLGEAVELVKAIRYQTVDIVEDIDAWQSSQPTARAFLYRGANYLTKIFSDLNFLDAHEEVVEKFCFEFTSNPLAYRGGGDICTGPGGPGGRSPAKTQQLSKYYQEYMNTSKRGTGAGATGSFDGIEIVRLRNAEKIIQREFDRLDREARNFGKVSSSKEYTYSAGGSLVIGEGGMSSHQGDDGSMASPGTFDYRTLPSGALSASLSQVSTGLKPTEGEAQGTKDGEQGGATKKSSKTGSKQRFNSRKVRLERIATLSEEAAELKAMQSHLEEQVNILVEEHGRWSQKRAVAEARRKEALAIDRDVAAQHLAVEISLCTSNMQDINAKIKALQRQNYFIGIERDRKRKVVKKLKADLEEEKKRTALEAKLVAKIKEGGLLNALKTLNRIQQSSLTDSLLGSSSGGKDHAFGTAGSDGENELLEFMRNLSSPQREAAAAEWESMKNAAQTSGAGGTDDGQQYNYEPVEEGDEDEGGENEQDDNADTDGDAYRAVFAFNEDDYGNDNHTSGGGDRGVSWALTSSADVETEYNASSEDFGASASIPVGAALAVAKARRADALESEPEAESVPADETTERGLYESIAAKKDLDESYDSAAEQDRDVPSEDQPAALETMLLDLAAGHRNLEAADFLAALASFDLVLRARRRLHLGDTQTTIAARLGVAETQRARGRHRAALEMYNKTLNSLNTFEASPMASHASPAALCLLRLQTLVGLADLHRQMGKLLASETSLLWARQAAAVAGAGDEGEIEAGMEWVSEAPFQLAVADCLASRAALRAAYGGLDNLSIARTLYEEALVARQRYLGEHAKTASCVWHLGIVALRQGRVHDAERLVSRGKDMLMKLIRDAEEATQLDEKESGKATAPMPYGLDHPVCSAATHAHGLVLLALGRRWEAAAAISSALAFRRITLGPHHPSIVKSLMAFAEAFSGGWAAQEEDSVSALTMLDEAMGMAKVCFPLPEESAEVPTDETAAEELPHRILADISLLQARELLDTGAPSRALPLLLQVVQARQRSAHQSLVPSEDVLEAQVWLCYCYVILGNVEEAQEVFADIWPTLGAETQPPSFLLFWAYYVRGLAKNMEGLYKEAHACFVKAISIHTSLYNPTDLSPQDLDEVNAHPDLARVLLAVSQNLSIPGFHSEAMDYCERCLRMLQELRGLSFSVAGTAFFTKASILKAMSQLEESNATYLQALDIVKKCAGEESSLFAEILGGHGECLLRMGHLDEADALLSQALTKRRKAFGEKHVLVGECMRDIASVLVERRQLNAAMSLYRDGALPLFENSLGHNHAITISTRGLVGRCLLSISETTNNPATLLAGKELVSNSLDVLRTYEQPHGEGFTGDSTFVRLLGGYLEAESSIA